MHKRDIKPTGRLVVGLDRFITPSPGDIFKEAVRVRKPSAGSACQRRFKAVEARKAVEWRCRLCGRHCVATEEAGGLVSGRVRPDS